MTRWLKVWWHCLIRTTAKADHRMCSIGFRPFCNCGYLNGGRTFGEEIDRALNGQRDGKP